MEVRNKFVVIVWLSFIVLSKLEMYENNNIVVYFIYVI